MSRTQNLQTRQLCEHNDRGLPTPAAVAAHYNSYTSWLGCLGIGCTLGCLAAVVRYSPTGLVVSTWSCK